MEEKCKLIKEIECGLKKKEAAVKYGIPASTVSTILKNKESIITSLESGTSSGCSKRMKKPMFQNIDKAVLDWFTAARNQNMPISGAILKEKAIEFAKRFGNDDFKASTGWLDKWKQRYVTQENYQLTKSLTNMCTIFHFRHGVGHKKACGESNDVREEDCEKWRKDVLPDLIQKYSERDVFNADETGLFFKCLPDKTLTFKNMQCHGGKNSKQRVTLMLAANMDGSEKLKILLIGKSEKPRCFRGVKWLPVDYKANSKAWMTGQLFKEWVLKLDKHFQSTGRKILLFIDNCPAHPKDIQSKLKCIELAFFPPNMTSKLQPLDQGVIRNLKCCYRSRIVKEALKRMEAKEKQDITLMDCINHVTKAWDIDVSYQTIANCFKKAGFGQYSEWDEEDDIPLNFLNIIDEDRNLMEADYEAWLKVNKITCDTNLQDYIDVDNELCTSCFPTDDDIVNHYCSESVDPNLSATESDGEGSVEETIHQPSKNDVEGSFRTLNLYLQTNDTTTDEHYKSLNKLESLFTESNRKKVHFQSLISEYFTSL